MNKAWLIRLWQIPRRLVERLRTLVDSILAPASAASPLLHAASGYGEARAISESAPEPAIVASDAKAAELLNEVPFWGLQAPSDLTPASYPVLFSLLQRVPGPKLLDLTSVRLLSVDIFDALAATWTVSGEQVPRLALVCSFERWIMLLRTALEALRPISELGVEVIVAYQEQHTGGQLAHWFCDGELRHNAPAAISTLRRGWTPDRTWPNVIQTLADLVRQDISGHQAAVLLTELAALALQCDGPELADPLARAALTYLADRPSATRSRALRHLGAALVRLGRIDEGVNVLDLAIAAGVQSELPVVAANPLYQRGQHALDHGDFMGAESRFRSALALLEKGTGRRNLTRKVHRGLAITLRRLGQPEAEHHAREAVALHKDPNCEQAALDRQLLAELTGMGNTN